MKNKVYDSGRVEKKPASEYISSRFGSERMQQIDIIERNAVQKMVGMLPQDFAVVDIPCGSGRLLPEFAKAKSVYAFDINASMLAEAQKNNPGEQYKFQVASAAEIPLPDGAVDGLVCMRLLHHVADKKELEDIISELSRVTKGYALITFYRKNILKILWRKITGKRVRGNPKKIDDMELLCQKAGLSLIESIKVPKTQQTMFLLKKNS